MLQLDLYDFSLPKDLVAQTPSSRRVDSRLMVLSGDDGIGHEHFRDLPGFLERGDALVVNDSKVLPAKLRGFRRTGGKVELLVFDRISSIMARCLVKGRVGIGDRLDLGGFKGWIKEKREGFAVVEFDDEVQRIMHDMGEMPLPPYIKRVLGDRDRYQTVYARTEGSIAAPTAGLHFSQDLIDELGTKGVDIVPVTLHINIGTFLPFGKSVAMPERFIVSEDAAATINRTMENGHKVFVVGTSTLKCLESACEDGMIKPKEGASSLLITPPYEFGFRPHAFLTNFHLPKSSVLLLTCAYAGRKRLLRAYDEAIRCSYRFYSFGDSMLIFDHGRSAGV